VAARTGEFSVLEEGTLRVHSHGVRLVQDFIASCITLCMSTLVFLCLGNSVTKLDYVVRCMSDLDVAITMPTFLVIGLITLITLL
jgi:hypothetical protein